MSLFKMSADFQRMATNEVINLLTPLDKESDSVSNIIFPMRLPFHHVNHSGKPGAANIRTLLSSMLSAPV